MKLLVAAVLLLSATLGCSEGGQVQPETTDSLRESAEQGDAAAQYNLGVRYDTVRYYTGAGVPRDDAEAVRWYRLAADQGHAGAQSHLGLKYEYGQGVPQDDVEAGACAT